MASVGVGSCAPSYTTSPNRDQFYICGYVLIVSAIKQFLTPTQTPTQTVQKINDFKAASKAIAKNHAYLKL